jgi:sulfatase modifying factor 1
MSAAAPAPARPAWAAAFGADAFGPFADLDVSGVIQRLRWCPSGRFLMGSPTAEVGRHRREGPQHEVRLTRGFWMADSPVTQALYRALIGADPSRFADPARPDRPVETVSWHEATALCAALEDRLRRAGLAEPGLRFRLPTEAEWEYACRAGTTTATFGGDLLLRAEDDAPALDLIAWTGGGAQPVAPRAGTRPVKQRAPNAWGLYDTLGNVWEWCADATDGGEYPGGARLDPVGQAGPWRISRGATWNSRARYVRAAYRDVRGAGYRDEYLGLRLCFGPALGGGQGAPVQTEERAG